MSKNAGSNSVLARAWAYDKSRVITGEALLIATLLHTHGNNRGGDDLNAVLRLMEDANVSESE